MKKNSILLFIILLLFSCETPCNRLVVHSKNNNGKNTFILFAEGKDTCLVRYSNELLLKENDLVKVVFPLNGRPGVTENCSYKDPGIQKFPLRVYLDKDYAESIYWGKLDTLFNTVNELFKGFQIGISFLPEKKSIIRKDYVFHDKSPDLVLNDLNALEIIDTSYSWHMFLLAPENFQSIAVAQNLSTLDHNMIFGGTILLENPIMVAHELLHSFPGHVDLSLGDSRYTPLQLIKNIMYNTSLPIFPRYSVYQNLQANRISISNYLGINFFPVDYSEPGNSVGSIYDNSDFITDELNNRMIYYYSHPFYNYLLAIHTDEFDNYSVIPNNLAILKDVPILLKDIYRLIVLQAEFLSDYGLNNKEKYIQKNYEFILHQIHQRMEYLNTNFEQV